MLISLAADLVVVFHLLFILFVLFGALLVAWKPWLAIVHLPAAAWGMAVEFLHLYCPLTPLENSLRKQAGEQGYGGGFVEHYLIALIYPAGLTMSIQLWLGAVVLVINVLAYAWVLTRLRRR
ncbi:DUF2784 domain-containing protein [Pseudomonas ovata]|uniref:DUF2784 domain-containing protein n=1 Tax=Pseudomonas ovata TaxID=1839709 RepID=UPI000D6938F2|nr:DUF2784 domain-containing protein [Pseudomonas ovata]